MINTEEQAPPEVVSLQPKINV